MVSVSFKDAVLTLYIMTVLYIFPHFRSVDDSIFIRMRRLKSKAKWS